MATATTTTGTTSPAGGDAAATAAANGFCEDCFKGFSFKGTPAGKEEKIGPFNMVYVARPEEKKAGNPAIVIITDVFGFGLPNPKLMADKISSLTGMTVYVPDLFGGDYLNPNSLPLPETPEEEAKIGIRGKIKIGWALASNAPWLARHMPPNKHSPQVVEFVKLLKGPDYEHGKIGAAGYCYGARCVTDLDLARLTDANVLGHPSALKADVFARLKNPTALELADADGQWPRSMDATAQGHLARNAVQHELTVYPGTTHGFAARGNLDVEHLRKAWEGSVGHTSSWFVTHLA